MPPLLRWLPLVAFIGLATGCNCGDDRLVHEVDGGDHDAGASDGEPADAGPLDAGTLDAGPLDAGTLDAGTLDAGTLDAGTLDAGTLDAGLPDAGPPDAGPPDAGPTPDPGAYTGCCEGGQVVVEYNAAQNKYLKVVLCSATRYDLFLGDTATGPFFKLGDRSGNGQDHCQLVSPTFTIVNDDDVASGNCPTCAVQYVGSAADDPDLLNHWVYVRSFFGEPFRLEQVTMQNRGIDFSCWYECGRSF
jgi:hypothetical protein